MQMKRRQVLKLDDITLNRVVRIQGTQYDRKRVLTDKDIKKMNKLFNKKGLSVKEIAEIFDVSVCCVKYNVMPEWKAEFNAKRDGKHTGVDVVTVEDRAAYKRYLVKRRKIKTRLISL